jgi:hypothetical protein
MTTNTPKIGRIVPKGRIHGWQTSPRTGEYGPLCQGGDLHYAGMKASVAPELVTQAAEITCGKCLSTIRADAKLPGSMQATTLRQRFGYLTGISAGVPMFVAEEIDAEVNRRRVLGYKGHAGKQPVVGDVVREVLISWARHVRAAREKRTETP